MPKDVERIIVLMIDLTISDQSIKMSEQDHQHIKEAPPANADQYQANADQPPADEENRFSHQDNAVEDNDDEDDDQSVRSAA